MLNRAVIVICILLVLFAGLALGVFFSPFFQKSNFSFPSLSSPSPQIPQDTSALTEEELWNQITNPKVEEYCLKEAKEIAGDKAAFVFSCICTESTAEQIKQYDCRISALDGYHSIAAACNKESESCTITSELGTSSYTLQELNNLLGS